MTVSQLEIFGRKGQNCNTTQTKQILFFLFTIQSWAITLQQVQDKFKLHKDIG
jgi:hypothetical protein